MVVHAGALVAFCQSCMHQQPTGDTHGSSPAFTAASQAFQHLQLTSEQLRSVCQLPWSLPGGHAASQPGAAELDEKQNQQHTDAKLAALQIQLLAATLAPDVCK